MTDPEAAPVTRRSAPRLWDIVLAILQTVLDKLKVPKRSSMFDRLAIPDNFQGHLRANR